MGSRKARDDSFSIAEAQALEQRNREDLILEKKLVEKDERFQPGWLLGSGGVLPRVWREGERGVNWIYWIYWDFILFGGRNS